MAPCTARVPSFVRGDVTRPFDWSYVFIQSSLTRHTYDSDEVQAWATFTDDSEESSGIAGVDFRFRNDSIERIAVSSIPMAAKQQRPASRATAQALPRFGAGIQRYLDMSVLEPQSSRQAALQHVFHNKIDRTTNERPSRNRQGNDNRYLTSAASPHSKHRRLAFRRSG